MTDLIIDERDTLPIIDERDTLPTECVKSDLDETLRRPPLYLQHYLEEREGRLFPTPPVRSRTARVIARHDNLIILEFREAPWPTRRKRISWCRGWWDAGVILLMIVCAGGCIASFWH